MGRGNLKRAHLVSLILAVFLGIHTLAPIPGARWAAYAAEPPPPLPVAEDPLGQQPEQAAPEISVDVDVRDGHLTVRVVDVWGPGRVPLVVRSYTNTASDPAYTPDTRPPDEPEPAAPPYNWQFNQMLDIVGASVMEPDGNRSTYRYSHDRWNANQTELWQVYVKDVGTYSTMEMHYNCSSEPRDPGDLRAARMPLTSTRVQQLQAAPSTCTWDGSHVIYLPKGAVRIYSNSKLVEERDANGNTWRYTWTTFTDGVGQYLSTATDPIGRQTAYAYERGPQTCTQWSTNDRTGFYQCTAWRYVYRLRTVTDPYGRTATYFYDGTTRKITSVTNGAGFTPVTPTPPSFWPA